MINPINRTSSEDKISKYKTEPYVIAADVYAEPKHKGQGGWTWYTGSAGWMYQLIIHSFIGVKREANTLSFAPCLPEDWTHFEMDYRFEATNYKIQFIQTASEVEKTMKVFLDGVELIDDVISLVDDKQEHKVKIELYTNLSATVLTELQVNN